MYRLGGDGRNTWSEKTGGAIVDKVYQVAAISQPAAIPDKTVVNPIADPP